jgi:isopenicillin-N N-acyltransferase-like protein
MAALHTVGTDSTTHVRYDALKASVERAPIVSQADLWERLGSHEGYPKSVCTHMATPEKPHKMRTCGALAMDLRERTLLAAPGCIYRARPHVLGFDED